MTLPVPRRQSPERWRGGWPGEFWDPFGEFTLLWERMGRFFERAGEAGPGGWIPAVETEEADDAYLVRAELPGMGREDVNVELRGHELYITGEVKEEEEDGGGGKTLRRRQGKLAYRAACPATPTRRISTPS
jgi:HSP20 family protein